MISFTEANAVEALVRDLPPGPLPLGRGSQLPVPLRKSRRLGRLPFPLGKGSGDGWVNAC